MGQTGIRRAFAIDEFAWWNLPALKGAWARVQAIRRRSKPAHSEGKRDEDHAPPKHRRRRTQSKSGRRRSSQLKHVKDTTELTISRREFWEIFTDYSTIRDNHFLALPIEYFDHFADEDGKLAVKQLLILMALFCNATLSDQLKWMFVMFDQDGDGTMDQEEMAIFMTSICHGLRKVALIGQIPPPKEIAAAAARAFEAADDDDSGLLSAEEFVGWGREDAKVTRIIEAIERARTESTRKIDVQKMKSLKSEAPLRTGGARSLLDSLGARGATRIANRVASQSALTTLAKDTKLTVDELRDIRDEFAAQVDESNELNLTAFCNVMRSAFPSIKDTGKVETLFTSFDTDHSGTIDFKEFTIGISKLTKGSVHDKLELLFECCDGDGDGELSIEEMLKFVHSSREDLLEATQFTEDLVRSLDKDGDGRISRDEFSAVVGEQPILYEAFAGSVLPCIQRLQPEMARFTTDTSNFTLSSLKAIWHRFQDAGGGFGAGSGMTKPKFRRFMVMNFDLPHQASSLINNIFDAFDTDNSGTIAWKEMFAGLTHMVAGTLDDKAAFYFSLFDRNNNNQLEANEVLSAVLSSRAAANKSAADVTTLLGQLDANGDGIVTVEEFRAAVRRYPELLECFGTLFGSSQTTVGEERARPGRKERRRIALIDQMRRAYQPPKSASSRKAPSRAKPETHTKRTQAIEQLRRASLGMSMDVMTQLQDEEVQNAAIDAMMSKGRASIQTGTAASIAAREHGMRVSNALRKSKRQLRRTLHKATKVIQTRTKARAKAAINAVSAIKFMKQSAGATSANLLRDKLLQAQRKSMKRSPTAVTFAPAALQGVTAATATDANNARQLKRSASSVSAFRGRRPGSSHSRSRRQLLARPETDGSKAATLSLKAMLATGAMMNAAAKLTPDARAQLKLGKASGGSSRRMHRLRTGAAEHKDAGRARGRGRERRAAAIRRRAGAGSGKSGASQRQGAKRPRTAPAQAPGTRRLSHAASFLRRSESKRRMVKRKSRRMMPGTAGSPLTQMGRVASEVDLVRIDDLFPSNVPENKYRHERPASSSNGVGGIAVAVGAVASGGAERSSGEDLLSPSAVVSAMNKPDVPLATAIRASTTHHSAVAKYADKPMRKLHSAASLGVMATAAFALSSPASGPRTPSSASSVSPSASPRHYRRNAPRRLGPIPDAESRSPTFDAQSPAAASAIPRASSFASIGSPKARTSPSNSRRRSGTGHTSP